MSNKVLITGPLIGEGPERLEGVCELVYVRDEVMSQKSFEQAIPDVWGIISMANLTIGRAVIDAAPNLKIISHLGVGYDKIDAADAASRGIMVTNTPDVLTEATADLGFALLLATARNVVAGDSLMRKGEFEGWKIDLLLGHEVHGKKLGIVGCGRIGQAVARRAAGFGMGLIYNNRRQLSEELESSLRLSFVSFDQMLSEADFIVITAPLNDQTFHLFTLDCFRRMKRTAIVINIGRGSIIKEEDLVTALKEKLIWGAGLDVLEFPPKMASGLDTCPNLTLTPHLGSSSIETRTAMCDLAVQAVLDALANRRPKYLVNN